jgi:enoyl-CoA hydratase/carnithine racemase
MPRTDHRGDPGFCTGGGAGIAACCDIRIGTADAKFGFPIARTLGNCLAMSNVGRLMGLIGPARVKDIIFTARLIEAQEALSVGLLSRSWRTQTRSRPAPTNSHASSPATPR